MFKNFRKLKHKFNAVRCKDDGESFDSKLERDYKMRLDLLKKEGEILFFLRQVPIRLPGGTKYLVDFVVFTSDGNILFIDVKGVETDSFKIKKREIEAIYPFDIIVLKKGDF